MKSKAFIGHIEHVRYEPRHHRLQYPLYVYAFDLDELPALDRKLPLFGYNRLRPAALHDRDYIDMAEGSIHKKLSALLSAHGIPAAALQVRLITSARYLNYVFNPVSFYCCFDLNGKWVCAVAEVNNTYGERHLYVLKNPIPADNGNGVRFTAPKEFHVSPFNKLEGQYEFFFNDVDACLDIRVHLIRDGHTVFKAVLTGNGVLLTPLTHFKLLCRYPILPHLSIPRIYFEALKLYFVKKLPFNDKPVPLSPFTRRRISPTLFERLCRRLVLAKLGKIFKGKLILRLPDGQTLTLGKLSGEQAEMEIREPRFFARIAISGEIGLGESYMHGEWESPDIVSLFKLFIDNRDVITDGRSFLSLFAQRFERAVYDNQRNTVKGSRDNIAAHYDLGNSFYSLFLDAEMVYSCGIFQSETDTLEAAQKRKIQRLIEKACISSTDHVLEIGCGWGAFAIEAVRATGCRVTAVTVSQEQHAYVTGKIRKLGMGDHIRVSLTDYRHIQDTFDQIVSVEMLEAVGHQYLGTFFACLERLLGPDGIAVIQTIAIPDQQYDQYCKERDWIQKYIFPGGHLPSVTAIVNALTRHSRLTIEDLENIGPHYALTLREWRSRFQQHLDQVAAMGFNNTFQRKWDYYFAVCEAAFAKRALGDLQLVLTRPNNNRIPYL